MRLSMFAILIWAGVLPFFIGALLLSFPGLTMAWSVSPALVQRLFSFYAMAIALFMAGTHWGAVLVGQPVPQSRGWLMLSNIQVLALWLVYALCPLSVQLITVIASLVISLLIDRQLGDLFAGQYFWHRTRVTICVICLLVWVLWQ